MTTPATLQRLVDSLVGVIYGLVGTLTPVIDAIETSPARPWQQRTSLARRFYAVIRDLLALTTRVHPAALCPNPPSPPRPERLVLRTSRPSRIAGSVRDPRPQPVHTPITARQLARCLAILLQRLASLAAEAATILPPLVYQHAAHLDALAGCGTLARPGASTWECAG